MGPIFVFVANFMIQRFSVVGCMRMRGKKQTEINTFQTDHYIPNRFQQLSVLFIGTSSTKLAMLLRRFHFY